jgi:hypothetical protein
LTVVPFKKRKRSRRKKNKRSFVTNKKLGKKVM